MSALARAQAAHAAGDALVTVALANTLFFAVPLGEARHRVGLYLALTLAPFSVLAPIVGPLLDRRPGTHRLALVVSGVGRALCAVVLASRTERLALFPLAFGLLVLSRVHGVSRSALVPSVVPPGRTLVWANAALSVISVIGALAGGLVGFGLHSMWGAGPTLWLAGAVFVLDAVAGLRAPQGAAREPAEATSERSTDIDRLLTARLVGGGLAMAASRATVGFLVFLFAFTLKAKGHEGAGFGAVVVAAGFGGFAASLVAPLLRRFVHETGLLLASLALGGVVALWAAGRPGLTPAMIVAGTVGAATGASRIAFDSLMQQEARESFRGRAMARYETIFQLAWVIGGGLATAIPFRQAGGLRVLVLISGIGIALSVHGLRRPRRTPPSQVGGVVYPTGT